MKAPIRHGQFRTCCVCGKTVMTAHALTRVSICLPCAEKLPKAFEQAQRRDERIFSATK